LILAFSAKPRALFERTGFSFGLDNLWKTGQEPGKKVGVFHTFPQSKMALSGLVENPAIFPQALPRIAQGLGPNKLQTALRNFFKSGVLRAAFWLSPQSVVVYTTTTNS
jgi:hypothetical protein